MAAFREKSRKHQQTQELYDRLKRKEMTAATRSAAFESVDEVLGNVTNRASHTDPPQSHFPNLSRTQQNYDDIHQNLPIIEHDYHHRREGSGGSGGHGGRMLPPPLRRAAGHDHQTYYNGES